MFETGLTPIRDRPIYCAPSLVDTLRATLNEYGFPVGMVYADELIVSESLVYITSPSGLPLALPTESVRIAAEAGRISWLSVYESMLILATAISDFR